VKFDTAAAAAVVASATGAAAKIGNIAQSGCVFHAGKISWKRHIDKHTLDSRTFCTLIQNNYQ
jgi:hypothetical protein